MKMLNYKMNVASSVTNVSQCNINIDIHVTDLNPNKAKVMCEVFNSIQASVSVFMRYGILHVCVHAGGHVCGISGLPGDLGGRRSRLVSSSHARARSVGVQN